MIRDRLNFSRLSKASVAVVIATPVASMPFSLMTDELLLGFFFAGICAAFYELSRSRFESPETFTLVVPSVLLAVLETVDVWSDGGQVYWVTRPDAVYVSDSVVFLHEIGAGLMMFVTPLVAYIVALAVVDRVSGKVRE